jgi:hypothetical protein
MVISLSSHETWPVFSIPTDDLTPGPTDLSYLLHKPAGSLGIIRIQDGHLVTGDGSRWRIWGMNLTARTCLPSMQKAPILARHLAKYGINCVRLHFMDLRWPNGILMRSSQPDPGRKTGDRPMRNHDQDTRSLDPEALACLDYFVACLKENGVYVDINLNVARPFTAADGVAQAEWLGYAKALTYFDPRLIELQKEYASQILGHVNPFTGTRYAHEPAVALVELVNENSLLESWLSDRLRGEQTRPAGTWTDIPPLYAAELDRRWNSHLKERYSDRPALSAAWQGDIRSSEDPWQGSVRRLRRADFPTASHERFAEESEFYAAIERAYFDEMVCYLQEEIGVRQIILGSSDHNQGLNNPLHLENLSRLGITDGHFYWQHPEFPKSDWSPTDWTISNTPMVDAPDRSVIARVARSRVEGMPYLVSETNCPFPNDFASGFIPILAAYARFQDWDGIFLYTYNESNAEDAPGDDAIRSFFAVASDPLKMAETAAGALGFLRGDVHQANETLHRHITRAQMIESQRMPLGDSPFWVDHMPGRLALLHRLSIADFAAAENAPHSGEFRLDEDSIISDTGELTWSGFPGDGRVCANTPRWQFLIGRAGNSATSNLALDLHTPYAALQSISLDEQPLSRSGQILLVTATRVANSGMKWIDASRHSLGDQFGGPPTRIEPLAGSLALRGLERVQSAAIVALDGRGQPSGQALPIPHDANGFTIAFNDLPPSTWYLITVRR